MSTDIRALNRSTVLGELLASTPTTRARLAEATGLSTATVTRTIDSLIAEGLARDLHELPSTNRGRRAVLLEARSDRHVAMGVDIGASNTRLLVVNLRAELLARQSVPTPTGTTPEQLAEWVTHLINDAIAEQCNGPAAVAIGLPGVVNPQTLAVSNAPHLPAVESPAFREQLGTRVVSDLDFDNDANYALLGERYFGAAVGVPNAVMFTLGTGLGAGVLIDGHLVRGRNGLVGEFGSLPVGPMGARLEHSLTGPSIMLRASELGLPVSSPADIFNSTGGRAVALLRQQYERSLVVAMTAAAVASDPEVIVLGGGIAPSLTRSIEMLEAALVDNLGQAPRIAFAELGEFSGAYGAAVQALHRVYARMGVHEHDLSRLPALASAIR